MYSGDYDTFLRLHSTYKHDLKCYSSAEGRCIQSAAGFLKGLFEFDAEINIIAATMVRRDEAVLKILDDSLPFCINQYKELLDDIMNGEEGLWERLQQYAGEIPGCIEEYASDITNCRQWLQELIDLVGLLVERLQRNPGNDNVCPPETGFLMYQRWRRIRNAFMDDKTGKF